jgi:hypothetical protein
MAPQPGITRRRSPIRADEAGPVDLASPLNKRLIGATVRPMTLTTQRRFLTPQPDEALESLAARALPGEPLETAMELIRGWNLHIFAMRKPRGRLLGSDVVFVEPPLK